MLLSDDFTVIVLCVMEKAVVMSVLSGVVDCVHIVRLTEVQR